jgi:hypothetical protein
VCETPLTSSNLFYIMISTTIWMVLIFMVSDLLGLQYGLNPIKSIVCINTYQSVVNEY